MFAEKMFLMGQLAIGDKVCVDKLADQTRVEDYSQYKYRNPEGRDVSYLNSGVTTPYAL